jgi:hypothetical protein
MKHKVEPFRRFDYRVLPVLFLIAGTACGGDTRQGGAPPTTVRDSAGIEIVESTRPGWSDSDAWRVEPVPALDLSASGPGRRGGWPR